MNFIISKEEFLSVAVAWNTIPNKDAADHILYNALRGHDLKRGFSPITKPLKLDNGMSPWKSYDGAKFNAFWQLRPMQVNSFDSTERKLVREKEYADRIKVLNEKFKVTFTPELIATLREMLK